MRPFVLTDDAFNQREAGACDSRFVHYEQPQLDGRIEAIGPDVLGQTELKVETNDGKKRRRK